MAIVHGSGMIEAILAAIVAVIAAFGLGRYGGRAAERKSRKASDDATYIKKRKDMDDAIQNDAGVMPDDAREWLHKRGKQ